MEAEEGLSKTVKEGLSIRDEQKTREMGTQAGEQTTENFRDSWRAQEDNWAQQLVRHCSQQGGGDGMR